MVKLSFCLPVYNQSSLVKECLDSIVDYKGKDIEIIVSDDCSTEDILSLVNRYDDKRIIYHRNVKNLGHDLNILGAMKLAHSPYVYLLRSRDKVISETIPYIVEMLYKYNLNYFTASAIDENGKVKIQYRGEKIYRHSLTCIMQDSILYTHPSGSIYRVEIELINEIENHLLNTIDTKYSFLGHVLLRTSLCSRGIVGVSNKVCWIYTNTENARDVATNSKSNKESVYSYENQIERFRCTLLWNYIKINKITRDLSVALLMRKYLKQVTWVNKQRYESEALRYHYNYDYKNIKVSCERKKFSKDISSIIKKYELCLGRLTKLLYCIFLIENITIDTFKYYYIWNRKK